MIFHTFAASFIGSKYAEKGWDCQDSADTIEFDNVQAVAVADGHGGKDYFRSQIGSKLAIEVLFNQLKKFCQDMQPDERLSDTGIKNFKYEFINEWRKAVKKDWDDRLNNGKPLGEGEIRYESVSDKYKARYTDSKLAENYLYTAYGTTLICAVSIGPQILAMQIGDGTCVLLQRDGEFMLPIPPEEENFLNVTVSLCDKDSALKIRHAIIDCGNIFSPNFPAAIFLSTDGLDDCFPYYQNEEHLYQLYADVIIDDMIKSDNFSKTECEIKENLLPNMTRRGSQDDISLAYLIVPTVQLRKIFDKIDARYKTTLPKEKSVEGNAPEKVLQPPKSPKNSSSDTKTSTSTIQAPPFMDSEPSISFAQSKPTSTPTQSLFKVNQITNAPPVQVGGTPERS